MSAGTLAPGRGTAGGCRSVFLLLDVDGRADDGLCSAPNDDDRGKGRMR